MKRLLTALMLLLTFGAISQTINPPSTNVGVGHGILKGTTVTVVDLDFTQDEVLLMQDNSTLIVQGKLNGAGLIQYGDVGDDLPKTGLVPITRSLGSINWTDYRYVTDVNPKVIIEQCVPRDFKMKFGDHVDVQFTYEPTVQIVAQSNTLTCTAPITKLTANVQVTGSASYVWSTGATTPEIDVTEAGIYTVTVTDSKANCVATNSITINGDFIPPAVAITVDGNSSIFPGESVTLTASAGDSYLWSNGATTRSITVSPATTTLYEVKVKVGACEGSANTTITVNTPAAPIANAGDDVSICLGQSTVLTAKGSPTNSYLWSNGETTQSITVSPNLTTVYTVIAYGYNEQDNDIVIVYVNPICD